MSIRNLIKLEYCYSYLVILAPVLHLFIGCTDIKDKDWKSDDDAAITASDSDNPNSRTPDQHRFDGNGAQDSDDLDGGSTIDEPDNNQPVSGEPIDEGCPNEGDLRCAASGTAAREICRDGSWVPTEPCG